MKPLSTPPVSIWQFLWIPTRFVVSALRSRLSSIGEPTPRRRNELKGRSPVRSQILLIVAPPTDTNESPSENSSRGGEGIVLNPYRVECIRTSGRRSTPSKMSAAGAAVATLKPRSKGMRAFRKLILPFSGPPRQALKVFLASRPGPGAGADPRSRGIGAIAGNITEICITGSLRTLEQAGTQPWLFQGEIRRRQEYGYFRRRVLTRPLRRPAAAPFSARTGRPGA